MTEKKDTRPLGELFTELKQETRTLIKQEMELVRVEFSEKISQVVKDVISLGVGGVLLYTGVLTLVAAIVLGLAKFMPPWLSALLVSIVLLVIGAVLLMKGVNNLKKMKVAPEKTTESLKETSQWLKSEMK